MIACASLFCIKFDLEQTLKTMHIYNFIAHNIFFETIYYSCAKIIINRMFSMKMAKKTL